MNSDYNRRDFLKLGAAAGAGFTLAAAGLSGCENMLKGRITQPFEQFSAPPIETVRVGYVGLGGMGSNHIRNLLDIEGVEIRAVCDIVEEKVAKTQKRVQEAGFNKPAGYSRGETDFKRMCEKEDLDLVYTATPWEWHVPVCVAAMESGKHAATEVPAAVTIDECWQLVETAEKTRKHCVMMENACYGRTEMAVLNLVRQGLLGELLHGEAGYMHDLRHTKLVLRGEGLWRGEHSVKRNGNLYPTHGLGPISQCMNINRGDKFDYLVSMSTNARGLKLFANKMFGPDHPRAKRDYANGDVNFSLIKTANGLTIVLGHDCDTPRPYSRINLVQGTKGIFRGYPDELIYIEARSPKPHTWEPFEEYRKKYDHPLWKKLGERGKKATHGSMDYIEDYRLIECLRAGKPTDQDVYDAASWSVVSGLSEWSVAHKSKPIDFPDFTRGKWKIRQPLGIIGA